MFVHQALKQVDMFGLPIQLTYKHQPNHRTSIGGLLTLCVLAIFIIAIYYFGKEVIERVAPTTIYNQEFQEHPSVFEIAPKTFPFAFGLQDGNTWAQFIDETIYRVSASTYIRKKILNKQTGQSDLIEESYPVNVGPCNVKEDLTEMEETIEYFQRLDVSQMYCIKKKQSHIPEIEGQWDASVYKAVSISFYGCKNDTAKGINNCKPQDVIDKKLSAGFFAMNYVDMTVNPRDSQHAYRYFGKDFYTYTSNLITKNIDFFLKHVEMSSDEGWLFEDLKLQHGVAYGDVKDMLDLRKNDNFVNIALKLQSKGDVYTRSYKKIQNVMAEVGGFLKSILIFFLIISFPFTQMNFYVDLLNQLFIFDSYNNNDDNNKKKRQQQNNEEKNINSNQNIHKQQQQKQQQPGNSDQILELENGKQNDEDRRSSALAGVLQSNKSKDKLKRKSTYQCQIQQAIKGQISQTSPNNSEQFSRKQEESFQLKQGGLELTFAEQVSYYICPKRKSQHSKMKGINQTINRIKEHLDAVYILNKLQEIDKIKMLILTPQQIRLFDLLSKPVINLDEQQQQLQEKLKQQEISEDKDNTASKYLSVLNEEKSHFQKIVEAYKIYEQMDDSKIDQQDKKLIDLLDDNIRKIFQKAKKKKKKLTVIQSNFQIPKSIQEQPESNGEFSPESSVVSQHNKLYIFDIAPKVLSVDKK